MPIFAIFLVVTVIGIFIVILFLIFVPLLLVFPNDVQALALVRIEGTLGHVGQVGTRLRQVLFLLLQIVLRYFEYTEKDSQVFQGEAVLGRHVLVLLTREESRVQLCQHLAKLYIVKLLSLEQFENAQLQ